jgi:hypothetical protein
MKPNQPNAINVPTVAQTGNGYKYVRCRAGGDDSTVYIHQLVTIRDGADPHDVFSDRYDCHHLPLGDVLGVDDAPPVSDLNFENGLELRPRWDHRSDNLQGVADD